MNAQKAEHWLRSAEADIPDGSRSLDLRAGIALLPEMVKLRQAQAKYNEQSDTIADLTDERESLQNGYDLAMSKLDPPPDGYPSWEDWLTVDGAWIYPNLTRGIWYVQIGDGYLRDSFGNVREFPDYPAALAAAKREAGDE